jgi:LPS-assembly lipoprotein
MICINHPGIKPRRNADRARLSARSGARVPLRRSLTLIVVVTAAAIGGCGFRLQGVTDAMPVETAQTYLATDNRYSEFYDSLQRALRERGASVVSTEQEAGAILRILEDNAGQRILSVSARNVPREYEVYYLVTFSLEADGRALIEPESLVLTRSYTYDETEVLGKSAEETELRQSLAADLARQVVRRIAADRNVVPTT